MLDELSRGIRLIRKQMQKVAPDFRKTTNGRCPGCDLNGNGSLTPLSQIPRNGLATSSAPRSFFEFEYLPEIESLCAESHSDSIRRDTKQG